MSDQSLDGLTYTELFQFFLDKSEGGKLISAGKKQSYTLEEDLKLMVHCNQLNKIANNDYKMMEKSKLINRSYQSIKDRYISYLSQLRQTDLNMIAEHLKLKGTKGFLVFLATPTPERSLKEILDLDPKSLIWQNKRQKDRANEDESEVRKKVKIQGIQRVNIYYEKEEESRMSTKAKTKKINPDPTLPKNEYDRFSIDEIDEVLTLIAQWKRVPKVTIVQKLHELSANMNDLDEYLNTLNEQYCWMEEEDALLAQAKSRHSDEFRLLIRTKGLDRIKRRIRFLGYQLPFEIE